MSLQGQCKAYFPFKENTSLTYTTYNRKGKVQNTSTHTISSIEQMDDGALKATVKVENEDKKGAQSSGVSFDVYCKNNTLEMDFSSLVSPEMQASFENMEVTISGDNFKLPSNLKVGQELPDIHAEIETAMNGFTVMTMVIEQTNKKVEAKESITTDAGTFECYKISYDTSLKAIMRVKSHQVVWYNEEVGMVKEEIYNKRGKLDSWQELTAYKK